MRMPAHANKHHCAPDATHGAKFWTAMLYQTHATVVTLPVKHAQTAQPRPIVATAYLTEQRCLSQLRLPASRAETFPEGCATCLSAHAYLFFQLQPILVCAGLRLPVQPCICLKLLLQDLVCMLQLLQAEKAKIHATCQHMLSLSACLHSSAC